MSGVVNGDCHPMVAGNLSNGVLSTTKTSHHHSNGATTTTMDKNLSISFHNKHPLYFEKPQISIESADELDDTKPSSPVQQTFSSTDPNCLITNPIHYGSHSTPNSPLTRVPTETDKTNLKVLYSSSPKSHSLPPGMIQSTTRPFAGYESDTSDDVHLSDEGKTEKRLYHPRKKHSDTLDSTSELYLDSSSESSSEEDEEGMQPLAMENDDEVFQDADIDTCNEEADTKLVDWAYNVFIPACRTLLDHCIVSSESERTSNLIQSDLRNLSNTINYFCSEQQRLSGILRAQVKGIPQSISADRFAKFGIDKSKTLHIGSSGSNASLSSESSSVFDGHDNRSYAVKVLRSVSQSLIAPLLSEAEHGFTHQLYRSIVQALQKISWKVEACLSFNDPSRDFEIHAKIFDTEQKNKVREMMIGAVPPEEPKLKSALTHLSVTDNLSNETEEEEGARRSPIGTPNIIRRTPSGRIRPSGKVFDPSNLPADLAKVTSAQMSEVNEDTTYSSDTSSPERITKIEEALIEAKMNYSPSRLRRTQTVAAGNSPKRMSQVITHRAINWEKQPGNPHYFRPKASRRTTISLSRHEVTNLGLRSKESMLLASMTQDSRPPSTQQNLGEETLQAEMEKTRAQLRDNLSRDFSHISSAPSPIKANYKKTKSASTPDLLDDDLCEEKPYYRPDSFQSPPTADKLAPSPLKLTPRKSLASQTSSDSDVFSPNYQQSFVPRPEHHTIDSEWVYIKDPDSTMDPRTARRGTLDKKDSKRKMTKSEKKAAKKANKSSVSENKRMSTSGKFTKSLIKTAQALRRGSMASRPSKKSSPLRRGRVGSLDLLSEVKDKQEITAEEIERPSSAMSVPPSMSVKSETMPTQKAQKGGTLSRLVSGKKSKQSRSFSKGDSLSRRKKAQRSGFMNSYPTDDGLLPVTDTIEVYSQNADKALRVEGDEQLLISVDLANKVPAKSQKRRSLLVSSNSGQWFEIVVTTNIKQFKRNHYTILRPFKQVTSLYDSLASSHVGHVYQFPDRPDRKSLMKKQKQQMEELLRWIAGNPELRKTEAFVSFLMPDDEFGNWDAGSEVSFDLLMTFYTPNVYPESGVPGSNHGIHMVEEPSKLSPSPTHGLPHKPSLQKRGTFYFVKGEKEDCPTFVIKEEGRDALIVACEEDDRYVVVAGTFEKLVEQLACEEKPDARFVFTFLLGYRHFAPTMELLTMLLTRFHMTVPPDATEEEMAYAEKWRYVIQLRVLDILTYWIKKCWPDFYRDSTVLDKVKEFIECLKSSKDTNFQLAGTNLEKVIQEKFACSSKQYTLPSPQSLSPASSSPATPTKSSKFATMPPLSPVRRDKIDATPPNDIQQWRAVEEARRDCCMDVSMSTAIQLARQLTLIELEYLKAIGTHELVVYTWESNSPDNKPYRKNIDAFIARFNKVSYWVASEICCVNDAKLRGALIEKFIEVAKHCKELKNFNTTISVVTGLSLSAVRRLKKSWEFVGEKPTKSFRKLMQITDPTNNHINYRKVLSSVQRSVHGDQCIPYFGVYMRDLTFLNDATQKTLKNGLLNFSKLRTMVLKFEELKRYQKTKYFFPPDKAQDFCRHLWCLSDSDLYDASLSVEPRDPPVTSPSTETEV